MKFMKCEVKPVPGVFTEENGKYSLDCRKALWATDEIHSIYQQAGIHLKDVDFVIETEDNLILIEYKNANISEAKNPEAFRPDGDRKVLAIAQKFCDSLHYLNLLNKDKPKEYVYILEYPHGDRISRLRLRNRIKRELPFSLPEYLGVKKKLIHEIKVYSIDEWNADSTYCNYPLLPIEILG